MSQTNAVPYQFIAHAAFYNTLAELGHAFVQYLAGEIFKRTPEAASVEFNDEEMATVFGESGDFMECAIWGGSVQIDRLPDPADTPSTLWGSLWMKMSSRTPTFKKITPEIIKAFTENPYNYDLKKSIEGLKVGPVPAIFTVPVNKKIDTRMPEGSMSKFVYWNVRFTRTKGKAQFNIVKKQTTLA